MLDNQGLNPTGLGFFVLATMFRLALGPTHPSVHGYQVFFTGCKAARAWSWSLTSI